MLARNLTASAYQSDHGKQRMGCKRFSNRRGEGDTRGTREARSRELTSLFWGDWNPIEPCHHARSVWLLLWLGTVCMLWWLAKLICRKRLPSLPIYWIITTADMGTSHEAAPNSTSEGRKLNRRVEVKVLANQGEVAGSTETSSAAVSQQ